MTITHHVVVCRDADGYGRVAALRRLVAAAADARGEPVALAFLTGAAPPLTDALTAAAAAGAVRIAVVSYASPPDANLAGWVRRVASAWVAAHSGPDSPEVVLATRADAGDDLALLLGRLDRRHVAITGSPGAISDPEWSRVPVARRHVLLCRGPRCSARGAAACHERLEAELAARGLGDDDVLVTRTGCLFPCNHGPLAVVQPDDQWYGRLDPEATARLVAEHLVGGRVLAEHALERGDASTHRT